jgi:hypothetical protein
MPKININGITREMTPEEVAEMERLAAQMPQPEPSAEERIATLEQRMNDIDTKVIDTTEVLQILHGEVTE